MEIKDILRKHPGRHTGYYLYDVSHTKWTESDLSIFRQLKTVPNKISAYFHRELIKGVFKSDCFAKAEDNYYLIQATDGTIFHIGY